MRFAKLVALLVVCAGMMVLTGCGKEKSGDLLSGVNGGLEELAGVYATTGDVAWPTKLTYSDADTELTRTWNRYTVEFKEHGVMKLTKTCEAFYRPHTGKLVALRETKIVSAQITLSPSMDENATGFDIINLTQDAPAPMGKVAYICSLGEGFLRGPIQIEDLGKQVRLKAGTEDVLLTKTTAPAAPTPAPAAPAPPK